MREGEWRKAGSGPNKVKTQTENLQLREQVKMEQELVRSVRLEISWLSDVDS